MADPGFELSALASGFMFITSTHNSTRKFEIKKQGFSH